MALQILGLANILTLRHLDVEAWMRQMGYPPDQARIAAQLDLFRNPLLLATMAAAWLALLVFLFSIRKHFRGAAAAEVPGG
jgi:hypothetical protein